MYKQLFYTDDLENLGEELVFEAIHDRIQAGGQSFCQCPVCIQDIAACILNRMPAQYQCSYIEKRNPRAQKLEQMRTIKKQIENEIGEAIRIVSAQPHH